MLWRLSVQIPIPKLNIFVIHNPNLLPVYTPDRPSMPVYNSGMSHCLNRTDYFIAFGLPAKVIYTNTQVQILSYEIETGDLVPDRISWATLYHSHDDVESVTEAEFEAYWSNLRTLCHLAEPCYYIIGKLPVIAMPVEGRFPDVRSYNLETDAFDTALPYTHLVGLTGEIGRVTPAEFESCLEQIKAWVARLQIPSYYIISNQPFQIVRTENGVPILLGYDGRNDRFIASGWKWSSLLPPVQAQWVAEVSEAEFHSRVDAERRQYPHI